MLAFLDDSEVEIIVLEQFSLIPTSLPSTTMRCEGVRGVQLRGLEQVVQVQCSVNVTTEVLSRNRDLRDDMRHQRSMDESTLRTIVQQVVAVAKPEKIIMFGSAARGERGPHSDVDLLVVKQGQFHRGHLVEEIYMNLIGVRAPGVHGQSERILPPTRSLVLLPDECLLSHHCLR